MFNVGILGCGHIASVMALAIKELEDVKVCAVASRSINKANDFVSKFASDAKAFGSYEDLAKADGIDLVYIATPNVCHYENAMLLLENGKNIIIEKPFSMSLEETNSIFSQAKNRGLFVCEAMWTAFMPLHKQILEWIDEGKIGEVKFMSANLGYKIDDRERLIRKELGGGSYLDLGVYPTHLSVSILGKDLQCVSVFARKLESGCDSYTNFVLESPTTGALSNCYVTMSANTDKSGFIIGSKGIIKIKNINNYEEIELCDTKGVMLDKREAEGLSGYALEIEACARAIEQGLIQTAQMPWNRTLDITRINDSILSMMR